MSSCSPWFRAIRSIVPGLSGTNYGNIVISVKFLSINWLQLTNFLGGYPKLQKASMRIDLTWILVPSAFPLWPWISGSVRSVTFHPHIAKLRFTTQSYGKQSVWNRHLGNSTILAVFLRGSAPTTRLRTFARTDDSLSFHSTIFPQSYLLTPFPGLLNWCGHSDCDRGCDSGVWFPSNDSFPQVSTCSFWLRSRWPIPIKSLSSAALLHHPKTSPRSYGEKLLV